MSPAPVTAVIVTYNSRDVVGAALDAAARSRTRALCECVVVDNASADGTAAFVRASYPWATVVESGGNLGYGRGCNIGLERAGTKYVLFQNPDSVLEPEGLEVLIRFLDEHPRAGMIGPAIVGDDGALQHAGRLPTPRNVLALAAGRPVRGDMYRDIQPGEAPFRTDWLTGALLLGRRDVINALGGFDPRFFLYFEETDLCLRLLEAGHELWAVGEAVATHGAHASAKTSGRRLAGGCIAEHYFPSRFYYLVKHHGWLPAVAAEAGELVMYAARLAYYKVRGRDTEFLSARFRSPIMRLPRSRAKEGPQMTQMDADETPGGDAGPEES